MNNHNLKIATQILIDLLKYNGFKIENYFASRNYYGGSTTSDLIKLSNCDLIISDSDIRISNDFSVWQYDIYNPTIDINKIFHKIMRRVYQRGCIASPKLKFLGSKAERKLRERRRNQK